MNDLSTKVIEKYIPIKVDKTDSGSAIAAFVEKTNFPELYSWDFIKKLKAMTKLPVLLKGILTKEDAELCLHHNIDGILVSNHGARQLDGVPATVRICTSPGVYTSKFKSKNKHSDSFFCYVSKKKFVFLFDNIFLNID